MLRKDFKLKAVLTAVVLTAIATLQGVETGQRAVPESTPAASVQSSTNNTITATHPLGPGPEDGQIAYVTARLLEENQYLHHRFNNAFSEEFLNLYLEALDPQHLYFTQQDISEFNRYRDRLDDLTLAHRYASDTSPAYVIFNRFLERLSQRVAYADELLKHGKFDFSTDERILVDRRDAPYPKDLTEAKKLWRLRVRYDYLSEKLARLDAKRKEEANADKETKNQKPGLRVTDGTAQTNSVTNPNQPATVMVQGGQSQPATVTATNAAGLAKETSKKTDAEEIADLLSRRYNRILRVFKEWDSEDVLQVYLTALAHVYDPHSDYMNKMGADNFAIGMNLALFGIGAVLTTDLDGYCKIQELKPGPAMKSKKIKVGDRIVAVAQSNAPPVDIVDMSLNKAVQLIRGPKGTEVRLTIIPVDHPSERRVVSLIRDEIKLDDQAAKGKIIELPGDDGQPLRLGVIDLPAFYATIDRSAEVGGSSNGSSPTLRSTSADMTTLLKKFEKENVSGVILDLRRNGGGSLEEAIKVTGLFIKDGPVVQVRTSDGTQIVRSDTDTNELYTGPLIVLTSRFSASASEIVAGALQDYGRALIVGDISTHGKGTVQNLNPLRYWIKSSTSTGTNDPGELKITIQAFYRPSGRSTQLKGVMPDIVLPSVWNYSKDVGESALDNPLNLAPIQSVPFDKLNLVEPCLAELLKRSNERVAEDKDFDYIRQDIELFRKRQADKTVSLNEQKRLREMEEADARREARDAERRSRKAPDEKIYELTLKQAALPGLPPPIEETNAPAKTVAMVNGNHTVSTNSTSVTATSGKSGSGVAANKNDDDEEKAPVVDATLNETEHILVDYISLLSQKHLLTLNR